MYLGEQKPELSWLTSGLMQLCPFQNTEGNIENIDVISNNNNFKNMTKVAVRKTNQKWTPAIKNGMIIRYRMRLPISMKARTE